ncbi:hypothetical protein EVAR_53588_1 [Eumeta japonica]|uniref:Uncharacterized protein n=1 Tax=Eumeta variegata TaxID=151549 RepID=A0A4C1YMF5_EUMVA|nr:hypothetical protein EVAR_53588_1 [Eumeta japonica]
MTSIRVRIDRTNSSVLNIDRLRELITILTAVPLSIPTSVLLSMPICITRDSKPVLDLITSSPSEFRPSATLARGVAPAPLVRMVSFLRDLRWDVRRRSVAGALTAQRPRRGSACDDRCVSETTELTKYYIVNERSRLLSPR